MSGQNTKQIKAEIESIALNKHLKASKYSPTLLHIRRLVYISIMVTLLGILSHTQIPLPGGVPMTLQTLGIALVGYLLGSVWGGITVILYVILGGMGVPVFASRTGIAAIAGPTGGFIIGFIPMVIIIGLTKNAKSNIIQVLVGILSILLLYAIGAYWLVQVTGNKKPFKPVFISMILKFGLKGTVSMIIASFASTRIKKQLGEKLELG